MRRSCARFRVAVSAEGHHVEQHEAIGVVDGLHDRRLGIVRAAEAVFTQQSNSPWQYESGRRRQVERRDVLLTIRPEGRIEHACERLQRRHIRARRGEHDGRHGGQCACAASRRWGDVHERVVERRGVPMSASRCDVT